jgi:peptide subunit release factor 1 (eRF1)
VKIETFGALNFSFPFQILTSIQQRLKLYNRVPTNGLVLYCGTIITDEGKEKKVSIDLEPFRPINTSLYLCDNKFHTEVFFTSSFMKNYNTN